MMKLNEYLKNEVEELSDSVILEAAEVNESSEHIAVRGTKMHTFKNVLTTAACAVLVVAIAAAALILPGISPADTTPGDSVLEETEPTEKIRITLGDGIFVTSDGLYNYYLEDGKAIIIRYAGTEETITIPTEVDGHEVMRIEAYCIEDNTLIPKEKGDYEFTNYSIYPLVNPDLEAPPYVDSIPEGSISKRKNQGIVVGTPVKHVTVPGTVEVGECAFQDCQNLVSVELLEGAYSVGASAFSNCEKNLVSVQLPSSLSKIGLSAFYRCHSLKEITIPGNVNMIDLESFAGCISLEKLTIEEGVERIGGMAFEHCNMLKEVIIPESVKFIDPAAFEDCTSLEKVTFISDETVFAEDAFLNTPFAETIVQNEVPESFAVSDVDLSSVTAAKVYNLMTGDIALLTEADDIAAICEVSATLSGTDPKSSRGYYGYDSGYCLYEVELYKSTKSAPLLNYILCEVSENEYYVISTDIYETIGDHDYRAMYSTDEGVFKQIEKVCDDFFK